MRLEYPRTIDKQMLDIFLKAQNALIDELYFAIEAWKDYAHITARLNSINTELKTSFSKYISASKLKKTFGWFVLIMGTVILIKEFGSALM